MKLLVIIPAYNEAESIYKTVTNLLKIKINNVDISYIIINDGSKDHTEKICKDNKFNVINLPKNCGIGNAVQTGYRYAKDHNFDYAIQFDGDGQHDENYIEKMVNELEKGYDFVIGSRFVPCSKEDESEFKSSVSRRFGIKLLSSIIKRRTKVKIYDPTSGFRIGNRKVIQLFSLVYPHDYPEPSSIALLLNNNYKVSEVAVKMRERMAGKSSISFLKSIKYMIKVSRDIIKYSKIQVNNETIN